MGESLLAEENKCLRFCSKCEPLEDALLLAFTSSRFSVAYFFTGSVAIAGGIALTNRSSCRRLLFHKNIGIARWLTGCALSANLFAKCRFGSKADIPLFRKGWKTEQS